MSVGENKAVFLSYASQDAAAARRISDALRSGGVEVWFDADGGLEHGDEWDQKIRRQIKECVLFIAVISANTQAREEGYFRLEWDLAAERARTIASGVPFILPVVIDETREPDALVPDRFRAVQWTRLRGGEVTAEVLQRFLKLWSHRTGSLKSKALPEQSFANSDIAVQPAASAKRAWPLALTIGATVAAIGVGLFLVLRPTAPPPAALAPMATAAPTVLAPSQRYASSRPDVARLLIRVQAMTDKVDVVRAELETALTLIDQATKLDAADASGWAERALVEYRYVTSRLDYSPARLDAARQHAKQAMSLDPKNANARLADALTQLLAANDRDGREAAAVILQSLVAEQTDRAEAFVTLANLRFRQRRTDEAFALFDQAARLPGTAGRVALDKAICYAMTADWSKANTVLDEALALERSASALLWKSYLATIWLGDAALAKRMIADIPTGMLNEDFPASGKLFVALWARDFEGVIATMRAIPRNYIGSGALSGPTGYYIGYALARSGRRNAAEIEWRAALDVVNRRLESDARNRVLFAMKALLLAALDDRAGAEKILQSLRELYPTTWAGTWEGHMLAMELLPPDEALAELTSTGLGGSAVGLHGCLTLDPFVDRLRTHPKFAELLAQVAANPKLNPAAAAPAPNSDLLSQTSAPLSPSRSPAAEAPSVAVLAFKNVGGDPANEAIVDGIGFELISVLGRVAGLTVRGNSSLGYFKGSDATAQEKGRKLDATYLVDGSVQRAGETVRISANLTRAATNEIVWSSAPLNRDIKNLFAVQEEIAGLIVQNLSLKLGASSAASIAAVKPEALELYVRARQSWNRRTTAGFAQAEELLNRALGLEPNFARAHAALADVWTVRSHEEPDGTTFRGRDSLLRQRTIARIRRALDLDPDSAEAYASLGNAYWSGWNLPEAERALRRAIELNASYASAHQWLGRVFLSSGRIDEAVDALKVAAKLDPLSTRIADNLGLGLLCAGRLTEALTTYERALVVQPGSLQALWQKAAVLHRLGRQDEASAILRGIPAAEWPSLSTQATAVVSGGLLVEAVALLPRLDRRTEDLANFLGALGRTEEALTALNPETVESTAFQEWLFYPVFDPMRRDPRFAKFLATLGMTEAHARAQAWRAGHPSEKPAAR